jgi:hypothetical protein
MSKKVAQSLQEGADHSHKFDGSFGCKLGVPGVDLSLDPWAGDPPEDPV